MKVEVAAEQITSHQPQTCSIPECDSAADIYSDQPDRCEYHHMEWGGVYDGECDCYQSSADNADVFVCYPHRQAYEKRVK